MERVRADPRHPDLTRRAPICLFNTSSLRVASLQSPALDRFPGLRNLGFSSKLLHGSAHSFPWTTWNLREPNGKLDLRGLMLAAFELMNKVPF